MKKRPPQFWLRLLVPFIFFFGGAGLIFWAQGLRIDLADGGIVSTGVLSVSTAPAGFEVSINKQGRGVTPGVFLGIPLGESVICLRKNNFREYCDKDLIDATTVTFWHNLLMLPSDIQVANRGPANQFLWDPQQRGYVKLFPELAAIMIYDQGDIRYIEDTTLDSEYYLDSRGKLIIVDSQIRSLDVFSEHSDSNSSRLLPNGNGILFHQDRELSLRKPKTVETENLVRFEEQIETAFFFPDSESILVFLPETIQFLHRPGAAAFPLFGRDSDFWPRFFPTQNELFWVKNGVVSSYRFPQR